jgi:quercetin dioxygenase-like cupin family protein
MRTWRRAWTVAAAIGVACATVALAQPSGIKRTVLQRSDVSGAEPRECVLATAEVEPGATIGKHFHPGLEVGYVTSGELDLIVDGEPTRRLRAGESYQIAARKPHDGKNVGSEPARVIVTYVVEKGKPLATPVK